jgi:hypothetical protein
MADRDKMQGLEMNGFENKEELQHLYREQQRWIANSIAEVCDRVAKHKAETQHVCREQQRWVADIEKLYDRVAKENYPVNQAALEDKTKEKVRVSNRLNANLVKAKKLICHPLLLNWTFLIILLIANFFVISRLTHPTKVAAPASTNLGTSSEVSQIIASPQVAPTQRSIKPSHIPEWGEVMDILEMIRSAQLKNDINLFLNAYSPSFPDINKKKENILKIWQQYRYLDMHYYIDDIKRINANTIIAKVTWEMTFMDVHTNKKSILLKNYTVFLSDVSGKLLIKELI